MGNKQVWWMHSCEDTAAERCSVLRLDPKATNNEIVDAIKEHLATDPNWQWGHEDTNDFLGTPYFAEMRLDSYSRQRTVFFSTPGDGVFATTVIFD